MIWVFIADLFTTVNPDTGERHPQNEPLTTLTKTRKIFPKDSPVMRIQFGLRTAGNVFIGDTGFVNDE